MTNANATSASDATLLPRVSFIVPAFNAAETVTHALASLAAQTVPDWEAIVVDDGSRDRTFAVLQGLAAKDGRLRIFRQANAGASGARNRALQEARAPLVAFLDADDWIEPDFLETLLPLAQNGQAIAYCGYQRVLPSGRAGPTVWCPELQDDAFRVLALRCEPAIHCLILPRELILQLGSFDTSLRTGEDWDLWQRVARTGLPYRGTPRPLASYRMRPRSLSTRRSYHPDIERVASRALAPDPRVANPFPAHAAGWQDRSNARVTAALARQAERLGKGLAPEPGWLIDHVSEDLAALLSENPVLVATHFAAAAEASAMADSDRALALLRQDLLQSDPWLADYIASVRDMLCVREWTTTGTARKGRWLGLPVSRRLLPDTVVPPENCDAVLVVLRIAGKVRQELALPLTGPQSSTTIYAKLIDSWALGELLHLLPTSRLPAFALALIRESLTLARHVADATGRRNAAIKAVRRALGRALGVQPPAVGRPATAAVRDVPIVLFDRFVAGTAGKPNREIGTDQFLPLLDLLSDEGYRAISFADLAAARAGARALPDNPLVLVFADAASALRHGVVAKLPAPLAKVELLFTPQEIDRGLPRSVAGPTVNAGLRVNRVPQTSAAAIAELVRLRLALEQQTQAPDPVTGALSDCNGLEQALLEAAGFALVLSPGNGHARVDLQGRVVPVIGFRGSDELGDILECLREAA